MAPGWRDVLVIALGAAAGANARYWLSNWFVVRFGPAFPWGTLFINVSGAFLIGIFGGMAEDHASLMAAPDPWLFAVTGFLGCYTTVSSFSLQTLSLARDGESARALGYVVISVALSLAAAAAGFALVDWMK